MEISSSVMQTIANELVRNYGLASETMVNKALTDVLRRTYEREQSGGGHTFSLSQIVRGLSAMAGHILVSQTAEEDVRVAKALNTSDTPGSYLIPQVQANEFIAMLSAGGVYRSMGPRVWDMSGRQKLQVPIGMQSASYEWLGQNTQQSASDPDISALNFELKTCRCLVAISNEALAAGVPAFDTLLTDILVKGALEAEDSAAFATTTATGLPTAIYPSCTSNTLFVNGSAAGGALAYSDIVATIAKCIASKARPPFIWLTGTRTFYSRILGMVDGVSRPLAVPTLVSGISGEISYSMFGWKVFVSPFVKEDLSNSSGTNQSWMALAPASAFNLAQSGNIALESSREFAWDRNQTVIRVIRYLDFGVQEKAVTVLKGID